MEELQHFFLGLSILLGSIGLICVVLMVGFSDDWKRYWADTDE